MVLVPGTRVPGFILEATEGYYEGKLGWLHYKQMIGTRLNTLLLTDSRKLLLFEIRILCVIDLKRSY